MAYAPFATVASLVSRAARELSLVSADIADPYASTDPNILQLCAFLQSLGEELRDVRDWSWLQKQTTYLTAVGTYQYALANDFLRRIEDTEWNRTSTLPVGGPVSPADWQAAKAVGVTAVSNIYTRIRGNQIEVFPDTAVPNALTIAYEYISRWFVQPVGQAAPTTEAPTDDADVIWFPPRVLVAGLKLKWKRDHGFDTTTAEDDFNAALQNAVNNDSQGSTIHLGASGGTPMLGAINMPRTGIGS